MKIQALFYGAIMLSIIAFSGPTNMSAEKKPSFNRLRFTAISQHLYNITDANSHNISKILFDLDVDQFNNVTITNIGVYDDNSCCGGSSCAIYCNVSWSGAVVRSGIRFHTSNLTISYNYPGSPCGSSGSVTLNGIYLDDGGIICD